MVSCRQVNLGINAKRGKTKKITQTGSGATSQGDKEGRSEATTSTISLMKPEGIHQMRGLILLDLSKNGMAQGEKLQKKKIKNTVFSVPR